MRSKQQPRQACSYRWLNKDETDIMDDITSQKLSQNMTSFENDSENRVKNVKKNSKKKQSNEKPGLQPSFSTDGRNMDKIPDDSTLQKLGRNVKKAQTQADKNDVLPQVNLHIEADKTVALPNNIKEEIVEKEIQTTSQTSLESGDHEMQFSEVGGLDVLYNGRRIGDMLYDATAQTVNLAEICYMGKKFRPEKKIRFLHMWYPYFLQFHKYVIQTLTLYEEWHTPLVTKFTVKGGWAMPKDVTDYMKQCGVILSNYARWFWPIGDGWTMCALSTQNNVGDLDLGFNESHYTGTCTMDVELYFIESNLVQRFIGNDC